MSEAHVDVDFKTVALMEQQLAELGRVIRDLLPLWPPERVNFKLRFPGKDEELTELEQQEWREYHALANKINAKALRGGEWPQREPTGVVLVWPEVVIPLLQHWRRIAKTLHTLRGLTPNHRPLKFALPDV